MKCWLKWDTCRAEHKVHFASRTHILYVTQSGEMSWISGILIFKTSSYCVQLLLSCKYFSITLSWNVVLMWGISVSKSSKPHFTSGRDVIWKEYFFHVCVICVQLIARASTHTKTGSMKTPLRRKHRTSIVSFWGLCILYNNHILKCMLVHAQH